MKYICTFVALEKLWLKDISRSYACELKLAKWLWQGAIFLLHMCASIFICILHALWCQSHFSSFMSTGKTKTFQTGKILFPTYFITINQSKKILWKNFNRFSVLWGCVSGSPPWLPRWQTLKRILSNSHLKLSTVSWESNQK